MKDQYKYTPHEQRVRASLGAMPAGVHQEITTAARRVGLDEVGHPCPITMEDLASYLEACVTVHTMYYAEAAKTLNAHRALVADVDALRRVLGTGGQS